jgi:hypothetical protein
MVTNPVTLIMTANRLRDGIPVYFQSAGTWSADIAEAVEAGEALLAEVKAGPAALPVIAPYLIEARHENGRIRPVSLRETIRAFGPTV